MRRIQVVDLKTEAVFIDNGDSYNTLHLFNRRKIPITSGNFERVRIKEVGFRSAGVLEASIEGGRWR